MKLNKPTQEQLNDYKKTTLKHIERVQHWGAEIANAFLTQLKNHDKSKFDPEEMDAYAVVTPELKGLEYGSQEYYNKARELNTAWAHHIAHNSHHPQHFENGVSGMSLIEVSEMLVDWKAASERSDSRFYHGLALNINRHVESSELKNILVNTAYRLKMITHYEKSEVLKAIDIYNSKM